MGLTFLLKTTYLLPLTGGALVLALVGLGNRASQRHGYGPLAVGVLSAAVLMIGRFVVTSDPIMYIGGGLLVVASIWNSWPKKRPAPTVVKLQFPCDSVSQSKEN